MDTQTLKELLADGYEGWWMCPYCGELYAQDTSCCSENHCEEIKGAANDFGRNTFSLNGAWDIDGKAITNKFRKSNEISLKCKDDLI